MHWTAELIHNSPFCVGIKNNHLEKPAVRLFFLWIKQELHPVEIKQEAEMTKFIVLKNNHQCPNLDDANLFRRKLFKQIPLLSTRMQTFLICMKPKAA